MPGVAAAQSALTQAPRDATPVTVVTPDFPTGAELPAEGVRVEISGTVLTNGEFKPATITTEGDHPRFVRAVSEVLKYWRFRPAVDKEQCAPIASEARASVWFEGTAAVPRVFVSAPTPGPRAPLPKLKSIWAPKVSYRAPVEGQVWVLMLIAPDGDIKAANIRTSWPPGYFDALVLKSVQRTSITWQEPLPQGDICAQREYLFCLDEDLENIKMPFQACRKPP